MPIHPFILHPTYVIDAEWVAIHVCWMLQFSIISFVAWKLSTYIYGGTKELRIALKAVFYFSLLDIIMYFICGKTGWYSIVYYLIAVVLIKNKFGKGK